MGFMATITTCAAPKLSVGTILQGNGWLHVPPNAEIRCGWGAPVDPRGGCVRGPRGLWSSVEVGFGRFGNACRHVVAGSQWLGFDRLNRGWLRRATLQLFFIGVR